MAFGHRRIWLLSAGLAVSSGLAGCGLIGADTQSAFCGQLEQAYPAFRAEPSATLGPDAAASDLKAYFDVSHQRHATLIAAAPAELTAPLTSIQTANDRLAAVYSDAEYDLRQVDAGLVTQLLGDSGHPSAVDALTAYAKDACHIDIGKAIAPTSS